MRKRGRIIKGGVGVKPINGKLLSLSILLSTLFAALLASHCLLMVEVAGLKKQVKGLRLFIYLQYRYLHENSSEESKSIDRFSNERENDKSM